MSLELEHLGALAELTRRTLDGLELFRAMPQQVPVFRSTATELLIEGGNRGGKSLSAMAKFAAVAREKVIYGPDGEPIEQRLPHQQGRALLMWLIGLQLNHIGQTIYRLLFQAGAYKIIRDRVTSRWRAYRPWDVDDAARAHEAKPAPPFIPPSAIKKGSWKWNNKAGKEFESVELTNGTRICCYASTADVKLGDPVDYIGIDERIQTVSHYDEWRFRILDLAGRIVWSSLPHPSTSLLRERAKKQRLEVERGERDKADVEHVVLKLTDNPHIPQDEIRKAREYATEDVWRLRAEGEESDSHKLYPHFDVQIHCAIPEDPKLDDDLAKVLRERLGEPPADWTRELILDPGTAHPAVLFCAVPPRKFWSSAGSAPYFVVYDELYVPRLTARQLARRVADKAAGYWFERFIIDGMAGRQTAMGFSGTVAQNYSREFAEVGMVSRRTGATFLPGDPNWSTRSQKVEAWLAFRNDGPPQLRIVTKRCPNLVWQLENAQKALEGDVVLDKPAKRQLMDCLVCLEYWASRSPQYVEPPPPRMGDDGLGIDRLEMYFSGPRPGRESIHFGPGALAGASAA